MPAVISSAGADGRLTLITGAAGGIGRALVARFVAGGDRVIAHDRDHDAVAELCVAHESADASGRVLPIASELPDLDALRAALAPIVAEHGPVGAAVANAGSTAGPALATLEPGAWHRDIDANLHAAYATFEAVVAGLTPPGATSCSSGRSTG